MLSGRSPLASTDGGRPPLTVGRVEDGSCCSTRPYRSWVPRCSRGPAFPWSGARRLARDLASIVDGFGSLGPRHARARLARKRADRWARGLVADVRAGRLHPPAGSALEV